MSKRRLSEARPRRTPPTIHDVAWLAQVSKSTVSNVIRGMPAVSPATRRRVIEAIEHLGYRPNVLARQLVQQRTTILGVIVGDLGNPFYAEMAKLLERHAFSRGYTTMFCNTEGDDESELAGLETLLQHRVAGLIFLDVAGQPSTVQQALARVPAVFVGFREEWGDSVSSNDEYGARLACEHLLALGHRRLAFLTTPVEQRADQARLHGFRQALALAGVGPGRVAIWEPPADQARVDGSPLPLRQLFTGPDAVTGVFASNDLTAIDLLEFCDRVGVRIPEDVSLVGFDDVPLAGLARISLTTIAQPRDELARLGVETLIDRLTGQHSGPPRHRLVDVHLVVRATTAPPRAASGG